MYSPEYLLQAQEKKTEAKYYLELCITLLIILFTCDAVFWNTVLSESWLWFLVTFNLVLIICIGCTYGSSRKASKESKEYLRKVGEP